MQYRWLQRGTASVWQILQEQRTNEEREVKKVFVYIQTFNFCLAQNRSVSVEVITPDFDIVIIEASGDPGSIPG